MAIIHVDETYPGLPNSGRLSGTDGDLVGIMDVALVANGWAIEYSTGNARIYRPGSGNRFRLYMNDAAAVSGSAALCLVRGCENASAASNAGLTDPFPLAASVADGSSNWLKSSAVSTAARAFDIWVSPTWVIYACNVTGAANVWDFSFFGDCPSALAGDSYNTVCSVRNIASLSTAQMWASAATAFTASSRWWWARSYDGTVKATNASPFSGYSANIGVIPNAPQAFLGATTGVDTQKVPLIDCGATSTTPTPGIGLVTRGWLPNIRFPLHGGRGTANSRDTYTDTAYAAGFVGTVIAASNSASGGFLVVEGSDTWSPPSG